MDIKLLPKSVRDNLRTGITIKSIGHCIVQLVLNSLDARSTSIAIRVNLITSNIQIIDNGIGISKKNLKLLGFRYATNKYFSENENKEDIFGFKGEALASIIKLSKMVTISSRKSATSKTYSKVFVDGKLSKIHSVTQRPCIGTTVLLEDVMHNMPVRKHHFKHSNCLDEIKHEIESIALIHPHTSFTVKNDATSEVIFQSYKLKYVYQTAALLYGKEFAKLLRKLNYTENHFTITGFIRIEPYSTNKIQFLYVNKRLVKRTKIHSFINHLLNKSNIFKPTDSPKLKYTAYIINLKCPISEIDIIDCTSDLKIEFKHWDNLQKIIEVAIIQFLNKHHFKRSPKPVSGLQLLLGSPVIPDNKTFRTSQVRGAIRGLAMKRKLEHTTKANSFLIDSNKTFVKSRQNTHNLAKNVEHIIIESAPKLNKTPPILLTAGLTVGEQNKGESQISLESALNNGKDLIMDMFLKSTAVYEPMDPKESDVFSFDTALNYPNRSVCILSSEENYNGVCTHFSFTPKHLMNPTNQHCNFKKTFVNPTLQNTNKTVVQKQITLQETNKNMNYKQRNKIMNTKNSKSKMMHSKHMNVVHVNHNLKVKYNHLNSQRYHFKKSSTESTYYNNSKYTIRKHIKRNTTFLQSSHFIQPAQQILKECPTKLENNVFRKKSIHVNSMIKSWFDFRQRNSILLRSNRIPFDTFNHTFYEIPIKQIPHKHLRLAAKKMPNNNYRQIINNTHLRKYDCQNITFDSLLPFKTDLNDDKAYPRSTLNDFKSENVSFDQNFSQLHLVHQTYINNKNTDALNITFLSYNSDTKQNNDFRKIHYQNDPPIYLRNKIEHSFDAYDLNSTKSPPDNVEYNKKMILCQNENKIIKTSTDQSYLFYEKSYISNTNSKVINYPETPQNEFIPYQTNPNLFNFNNDRCKQSMSSPNNSAIYPDILNSNSANSRIYNDIAPKHINNNTSLTISDTHNTKCINTRIPPNHHLSVDVTKRITSEICQNVFKSSNTVVQEKHDLIDNILGTYNSHSYLHIETNESIISNQSTTTPITVKSFDFSKSADSMNIVNMPNNQQIINASYSDTTERSHKHKHNIESDQKSEYNHEHLNQNGDAISPIIIENTSENGNVAIHQKYCIENDFSNSLDNRFVKDLDKVKSIIEMLYDANSSSSVNKSIINDASYTDYFKNKDKRNTKPKHMVMDLEFNDENMNKSKTLDTINNVIVSNKHVHDYSFTNNSFNENTIKNTAKVTNNNNSNVIENYTISNNISSINPEIHTKWSKQTTLSGNQFYLNDRTGMTSFLTPKTSEQYSMTKRYSFMPKGMSQIQVPTSTLTTKSLTPDSKKHFYETITNSEDCLRKVKWINYFETKGSELFFNELFSNKHYFETAIPNIRLKSVSKKVANALDNFSFLKESIDQITVINQWDLKFIITKICIDSNTEVLACFDQHAVHERILLEQLLQDYYEIKNEQLKRVNCNVPVTIKIEQSEVQMLENYKLNFENWGFSYEVNAENVTFIRIPKCWQVKDDSHSSNKNCLKKLLESLIQEESNWLRSVGHMHTALPLVILNGIKMEACRGAIKFGDTLTKDQCTDYIKKLSSCDLPFQCAHGRPTVVPLLNLQD